MRALAAVGVGLEIAIWDFPNSLQYFAKTLLNNGRELFRTFRKFVLRPSFKAKTTLQEETES